MDTEISARVRPDDVSGTDAKGEPSWPARWRSLDVPPRRPGVIPMAARHRLLTAVAFLLILILGLLTRAAGLSGLGAVLLALFLVFGVGAAVTLTAARQPAISFAVYSAAAGLAITTGIGFTMAQAHLWFPQGAFALVASAAAALLLNSIRRDAAAVRQEPARPTRSEDHWAGVMVSALTLVGVLVAAGSAATRAVTPQPEGLLGSVGPIWYAGCALIMAAFGWAIWVRVSPAAPILAAGTVVILSQALMYQAPTVMAAARHVGMSEYIRIHGSVDASQDIYQGWPGLFAGTAWLVDATGSTDLLRLATWCPVLFTPVTILAVRLLAGRFLPPFRAWLAASVYALGGAVNSAYYAPQMIAFLLSLVVLALLVAQPTDEERRHGRQRLAFALGLICSIVVTHQISPFMLGFALAALVLFRLVRPWWAPLLAMVPAVAWALVHRHLLARYVDIHAIGNLLGNIAPPDHPDAVAGIAPVTRLVFYVPSAALAVLGVIALFVVARRRDRLHLGLAAAMASPLGLALATNYGQEGVFRIVLFALPWLGILVASGWTVRAGADAAPANAGRDPARHRWILVLAFAIMSAVNAYGQSGLDWARILRPDDAAVTTYFERSAANKAVLLSLGTKNATPARITERYDEVGYTSRQRVGGMSTDVGAAYDPKSDLEHVTETFTATYAPGGHYLYLSNAIGAYDDRYGLQHYADYERLQEAVEQSPDWSVVMVSPTAQLYKLRNEPLVSGR